MYRLKFPIAPDVYFKGLMKYFFYNKWLTYFGFNFLCSEKGLQKISIPTDRMSVLPHKLAIIVSFYAVLKFFREISCSILIICLQAMRVTHA
jgi:hypothetical protein